MELFQAKTLEEVEDLLEGYLAARGSGTTA